MRRRHPGSPSGGGNNNPNTSLPQLRVGYAGFIGTSLTTSDPVRCATADCNMTAPPQVPRPEGTDSYRQFAGFAGFSRFYRVLGWEGFLGFPKEPRIRVYQFARSRNLENPANPRDPF